LNRIYGIRKNSASYRRDNHPFEIHNFISPKFDALKYFLLLLFLPSVLSAQVNSAVENIVSKDYLEQIRKLRGKADPIDSVNNARNTTLKLKGIFYPGITISKIKRENDFLQVYPYHTNYLKIAGAYSAGIKVSTHNRLPDLQSGFVQGRSQYGVPIWQGPETNEVFSYGPTIQSLEFDGSTYPYDQSGKLVTTGTGNGKKATAYDNNIFRTAVAFSQQFNLQGELHRYQKRTWDFGLKLGQTSEKTIIKENQNTTRLFAANLGTTIKWFTIKGNYYYSQQAFSNGNRNGFLNRVYQNALLTPVSFSNAQGSMNGEKQRSYSNLADNPYFLLQHNNNRYRWAQQDGGLSLNYNTNKLTVKTTQSIQHVRQQDNEVYKPGTAGWEEGMYTGRDKEDLNYTLQSEAIYQINFYNYRYTSSLSANYIYANQNTTIHYDPDNSHYKYHRVAHDMLLNSQTKYSYDDLEVTLYAGNKFYISNTATNNSFFLPAADLYITLNNLLRHFRLNVSSSYHQTNSELPINRSLAYTNLLQYSTQQAFQYRPVTEVTGYDHLSPIHHKEWTGRIGLDYNDRYTLSGSVYIKNTRNDILPFYNNGQLQLKNVADLQNKGFEISLNIAEKYRSGKFTYSNNFSFFTYRNTVTNVREGYNFMPLAGFSNVHTALVKGQQLGVIVGNSYLHDTNNNIIIGDDGFPLVDPQLKVIGNPVPDFVVKMNNSLRWKRFLLQLDWEWKKGGETWNGTQAALDYYGRSAASANERNTTGYVFKGVLQNGHINDIPVNFYDATLPVENNRWVRYGLSGVAANYIQKTDYLRLNNIQLSYKFDIGNGRQYLTLSMYLSNLMLWTPYRGADPNQLMYDQPNTAGLDFFNLPAAKTYGFNVSLQF
jgi:hypothetical protein